MTNDRYDVFISWAHQDGRDNIGNVKKAIIEEHQNQYPKEEELKIFMDTDIEDAQDWKARISDELRKCQVFLSILSPNYFGSKFCTREMSLWKNHEIRNSLLNKATLPVYFIKLDEDPYKSEDVNVNKAFIQQIHGELKPWFGNQRTYSYEEIKNCIKESHIIDTLKKRFDDIKEINKSNKHSNLPDPDPDFVGRVQEISDINAEIKHHIVLLRGEEGIGKTSVALAYASAYAGEYPGGRYMIDCQNAKNIPEAFAHLLINGKLVADNLGITTNYVGADDNEYILNSKIVPALTKANGKKLIILDDVTELKMLQTEVVNKYLNWRREACVDIIATTNVDGAEKVQYKDTDPVYGYNIDPLSEVDALEMLRNERDFSEKSNDEDYAKKIIERLNRHAGDLNEAANRLKQEAELTYDKLCEYILNHTIDGLRKRVVEKMEEDEKNIAEYAALLPADCVHIDWLKELFVLQKISRERVTENIENAWENIQKNPKTLQHTGRGHSQMEKNYSAYIEASMENRKKNKKLKKLEELIIKRINNNKLGVEEINSIYQTINKWWNKKYFVFAASLIASDKLYEAVKISGSIARKYFELVNKIYDSHEIEKNKLDEKTPGLMECIAKCLSELGKYKKAKEITEKIFKRKEKIDADLESTLLAESAYADCLFDCGEYKEANKHYEKIFKSRSKLNANNPHTINAESALARSYASIGQLEEALKHYNKVVRLKEKLHMDSLWAKLELAIGYSDVGDYKNACKICESSVKTETDELRQISAKSVLAGIYTVSGKYTDARNLRDEIFKFREENLGKKHLLTLRTQGRLAASYSMLGDYKRARDLRQKVLDARKDIFSKDHPEILKAQLALAASHSELGEYKKAHDLRKDVLTARQKKKLPDDHPDILKAKLALAVSHTECGDYIKSLNLREKIYDTVAAKDYNPLTPAVALALADSYYNLGKYSAARRIYENIRNFYCNETEAKNKRGVFKGLRVKNMAPYIIATDKKLADCDFAEKYYQKAEEKYKLILNVLEKQFGKDHPEALRIKTCVANCYSALGQYDEALKSYETIEEELKVKLKDENHPDRICVLSGKAHNYFMNGKYEDALKLRKDILEKRRRILGEDHPETLKTRRRVADCYLKLKKYNEALNIYNEILDKTKEKLGEEHPCTKKVQQGIAEAAKMLKG